MIDKLHEKNLIELLVSKKPLDKMHIQIIYEGMELTIELLEKVGEGQFSFVLKGREVGGDALDHLGEVFAIKLLKPFAEDEEPYLKRINSLIRGGESRKEIKGIQSEIEFATFGERKIQLSKLYSGDLGRLGAISHLLRDKKMGYDVKSIYSLFSSIAQGHIYLINHGVIQLDNSLKNYYYLETTEGKYEACIGDLESCYLLNPSKEGTYSSRLSFTPENNSYVDISSISKLALEFNKTKNVALIKEIHLLGEKMVVFSLGYLIYGLIAGHAPYKNLENERYIQAKREKELKAKFLGVDSQQVPMTFTPLPPSHPHQYPLLSIPPESIEEEFILEMLRPDPNHRPALQAVHEFLISFKR